MQHTAYRHALIAIVVCLLFFLIFILIERLGEHTKKINKMISYLMLTISVVCMYMTMFLMEVYTSQQTSPVDDKEKLIFIFDTSTCSVCFQRKKKCLHIINWNWSWMRLEVVRADCPESSKSWMKKWQFWAGIGWN